MTQAVNNPTQIPAISKLGLNDSGRMVYQITEGDGKITKLSVAKQDSDKFEKSYNEIITQGQKLHEYSKIPEEKLKANKNKARILLISTTAIGALVPMIKAKGSTLRQSLLTIGGSIIGFVTGSIAATSMFAPPGITKISKASQVLSKLDIKPEN